MEAFRELDIFITEDSGNGQTYGGYFCPHSQDPVTATRSSAREAYYETAENRTNYHLLPETHVTRLLTLVLPGHTHITGVEASGLSVVKPSRVITRP